MMDALRSSPGNPDGADRAEARRDLRRRAIVDEAVSLSSVSGTLAALEYLKSHAIGERIIARVLLEPARRRGAPGLASS